MPGSNSRSSTPGHVQVKKKHMVTIIAGALATIVGAATPGFLSWMEGAGEQAEHSQEIAKHANVKSDIAYQQVWTQMQFLQAAIDGNKEDMRALVQRVDMLIMLYKGDEKSELPPIPERPVRRSVPRPRTSELDDLLGLGIGSGGGSGAGFEDLEGASEVYDEESAEMDTETNCEEIYQAPIQQQMIPPKELEAMVKEKVARDKEVYEK